jgi:hypothetical protein
VPLAGRADRILILGVARSGTSWLGRATEHSPGTRFFYEPDNVDSPASGGTRARGFGPYPVLDADHDDSTFRPLWDAVWAGHLPATPGAKVQAMRATLRLPRPVRDPIIRAGSRVLQALPWGPERTVAKSIMCLFSLDWLVDRYEPRVVVLQRNPRNVVSSWRELRIPLFDLATRPEYREKHGDRLGIPPPPPAAAELAFITWHVGFLTEVLADACARHPTWMVVDHEALCADPSVRIREVFDAAGLPWSPDVDRFLADHDRPGVGLKPVRVTKEQPDRWRQRLTDAEVAEVDAVLGGFAHHGWIRTRADRRP